MTISKTLRQTVRFVAISTILVSSAAAGIIQPTEGELRKLSVGLTGAKYRDGGRDRSSGFDGGGLVSHLFKSVGLEVSNREDELAGLGRRVGLDDVQSWDLVVIAPGTARDEAAIGVVLGGQDFIFVSKETSKVTIGRLDEAPWKDRVVGARRLLDVPGAAAETVELADEMGDEEDILVGVSQADQVAIEDEIEEAVKKATRPPSLGGKEDLVGLASYYGGNDGFTGKRTSSGERLTNKCLTAAHRTLPFGTRLKVVNLSNGREVVVRVNDRGPHRRGRVLDLSYAAAKQLGFLSKGLTKVRCKVL